MNFLRLVWLYFRKSPWYVWILRLGVAYLIFVKFVLPRIKGGP